jgi:hypothetical protein
MTKLMQSRELLVEIAMLGGVLAGLAMLLTAYFSLDHRALAVPAFGLLIPSLIWGMR